MNNTENYETRNENIDTSALESNNKKPIFKRVWFWCIIATIILAGAVCIYCVFFNSAKPKYDENGVPVFVELSNDVYSNADDYLGYHVSVKGIVFQVIGNSKNTKDIHVWLAPEENEQTVIIQCETDTNIYSGDYISCEGYIKRVSKFKNDFGTTLITPIIHSTNIQKITYMEAMRPTLKTVRLNNAICEQYGYSITVNKVEFSDVETRVYITVKNKGSSDFTVYEDYATIVQNGKQYDTQYNRDANYEEIAHEIVVGASSSGVITFPAIKQNDFQFIIEGYTPVYEEDLEKYIFNISMNGTSNQPTNKANGNNAVQQNNVVKQYPKNNLYDVQAAVIEFCNMYNTSERTYGDTIGCFVMSGTEVTIKHSAGTIPQSAYAELSATGNRLLYELVDYIDNNYSFPEYITITLEENYWFLDDSYYEEDYSEEYDNGGLTDEDGYWEDGYFYFYE